MHSTVHHNLCLTHHKHTSEPPETLPVKPIIWCSSPMNLLPLCISGEEILNGYWLNKLIRAWNNENAKWEVWDHSLAGEVNVALWGQSDCPVAQCNSDRKEQWDITHPGNIAQRVRGVTWLCFCLSVHTCIKELKRQHRKLYSTESIMCIILWWRLASTDLSESKLRSKEQDNQSEAPKSSQIKTGSYFKVS